MVEYKATEESLNRFLAVVGTEMESYKRFMELYASQLAPGFNAFECLNPNENRLSSVIAMLLDPNGGHGQGATFFRCFLKVLAEGISDDSSLFKKIDILRSLTDIDLQAFCAVPGLEVSTSNLQDSQRRIDILLHLNTTPKAFGFAIENKPWAFDQIAQIQAYDEHLSKEYGDNFIQVYLSGNGEPPDEASIKSSHREYLEITGKFIVMGYNKLKKWCIYCSQICQAPRLRLFLDDFAIYIRDNFEGGIPPVEEQAIVMQAMKSENISAAFAIGMSWPKISNELISKLVELVVKEAGINKKEWETTINYDFSSKSYFRFIPSGWKHYAFEFGFDAGNTRDCYFGIVKPNGGDKHFSNNIYRYENTILGKGKSDEWYPWYKYFNGPFSDWSSSDIPWVGIKEGGETVKLISGKLGDLIAVCRDDIDRWEMELNDTPIGNNS